MSYNIFIIPPENLCQVWSQVAPILQRPIDKSHGEETLYTVKNDLFNGKGRLVTIWKENKIIAVNTLDIRTFATGKKALYIPLTGGDELDGWMPEFLEFCKGIARQYGCEELRGIAVRKGWMKKLAPLGWEEVSTTISCKIED